MNNCTHVDVHSARTNIHFFHERSRTEKLCRIFSKFKNSPLDTKGTLVDKSTLCTYTVHKNIKNKHLFVNMVKMWIGTKKA